MVAIRYFIFQVQVQLSPTPLFKSSHLHARPLIDSTHSAGILQSPSEIWHLLNSTILTVSFMTVSNSAVNFTNDSAMDLEFKIDRENTKTYL